MPVVTTKLEIAGNPQEIYEIAKDMESYPNYMKNVVSIKTLERGENYTVTAWKAMMKGRPFNWTERDDFDDEARRIDYKLVKGDLKIFQGAWTFEPTAVGTLVTLTVEFELGIPMFATLLNPIAIMTTKQNCDEMLAGLKEQVEDKAS